MTETREFHNIETVRVECLNREEGLKDKFLRILPGWDVRSSKRKNPLLADSLNWTFTKKLENGQDVTISVDTYTYKGPNLALQGCLTFSKEDLVCDLKDIRTVEFDYGSQKLTFNGGNVKYVITDGTKHVIMSKDGVVSAKISTK